MEPSEVEAVELLVEPNVVVSDRKIGIPVQVIKTEIEPSNEVIQGDNNLIQLWVCEDCDLRYKYYTSYLNHVEREHPDKLEEDDTESSQFFEDQREESLNASSLTLPKRRRDRTKYFHSEDTEEHYELPDQTDLRRSTRKRVAKTNQDPDYKSDTDDVGEDASDDEEIEETEVKTTPRKRRKKSEKKPVNSSPKKKTTKKTTKKTNKNREALPKKQGSRKHHLNPESDENTNESITVDKPKYVPKLVQKLATKIKYKRNKVFKVAGIPDTCRKCGEKFDDDNLLCEHLRWNHFEVEKGNIKVNEEGKLVPIVDIDALHKKINAKISFMHRERRAGRGKCKYTCEDCPQRFRNDFRMAIHRRDVHQKETYIDGKLIEPVLPDYSAKYRQKIVCEECGKLVSFSSLKQHQLAFHDPQNRMYRCDQCDSHYFAGYKLLWHRRTRHPVTDVPSFICEHCAKGFNTRDGFKRHLEIHEGRRFICKECGKSYKCESGLRLHRNIQHEKVMKNQCEFCGRRFWCRGNMMKHIKLKHQDGVFHPDFFEENSKRDWSNVRTGQYINSRTNRSDELFRNNASSSNTADNDLKEPAKKRKKTTDKAAENSLDASAAVIEESHTWDDSNSTTYTPNNESIDFSLIHDPPSSAVVSMADHQTYSFPQQQVSSQYHHHHRNTRHSSQNLPTLHPVSQSQFPSCCQTTFSGQVVGLDVQQLHLLSTLNSSSAAQSQLQTLQNNHLEDFSLPIPGTCKLCFEDSNDIRSHYLTSHKVHPNALRHLMAS